MAWAKRMDVFTKLFGEFLVFVYHCFDRIVIHGYLTALSRPELVVKGLGDTIAGRATPARPIKWKNAKLPCRPLPKSGAPPHRATPPQHLIGCLDVIAHAELRVRRPNEGGWSRARQDRWR